MKQYLDLLRLIRENGVYKSDRTGVGCYSIFGHQMRFNLADGFPLVTTKKTHLKSIIHELLWFLQGETNIRYLKENGVKIWDEWVLDGTAEYRYLTDEEIVMEISTFYKCPAKFWRRTEIMRDGVKSFEYTMYNETPADGVGVPCSPGTTLEELYEETFNRPPKKLVAGELGPVYGSQWRSWPNPQMVKLGENLSIYERCVEANQHDDYFELLGKAYVKPSGPERNEALKNLSETFDRLGVPKERRVAKVINPAIDQIDNLINQLKNNPDSRRLIVSAWNPAEVDQMALPPCHCLFQFYTAPLDIPAMDRLIKQAGLNGDYLRGTTGTGLETDEDYFNYTFNFCVENSLPTRKLTCQLYQRKSNCALIA